MTTPLTCPTCGRAAVLVTGDKIYGGGRWPSKYFWRCPNGPCDTYVGTHANSKDHAPFGTMANKALRAERHRVHLLLDPLWQGGKMKRWDAYCLLTRHLEINPADTHVGYFDLETCRKAIDFLKGFKPA